MPFNRFYVPSEFFRPFRRRRRRCRRRRCWSISSHHVEFCTVESWFGSRKVLEVERAEQNAHIVVPSLTRQSSLGDDEISEIRMKKQRRRFSPKRRCIIDGTASKAPGRLLPASANVRILSGDNFKLPARRIEFKQQPRLSRRHRENYRSDRSMQPQPNERMPSSRCYIGAIPSPFFCPSFFLIIAIAVIKFLAKPAR